jgi:hypothetical protein
MFAQAVAQTPAYQRSTCPAACALAQVNGDIFAGQDSLYGPGSPFGRGDLIKSASVAEADQDLVSTQNALRWVRRAGCCMGGLGPQECARRPLGWRGGGGRGGGLLPAADGAGAGAAR